MSKAPHYFKYDFIDCTSCPTFVTIGLTFEILWKVTIITASL